MTRFDVDIDDASVKASLEELKNDFEPEPSFVVESGAEYSVYLEFGTEDMPPYPFFRPAIRELKADPEAFLLKNSELDSLGDIDSTAELVKNTAQALERQIKINATAQAPGRSPGTDADHPQVQTGNLRAKIRARRIN